MSWLTRRHAVEAALRSGTSGVLYVLRKDARNSSIVEEAQRRGVPVQYVSTDKLQRLAGRDVRGVAFQTVEKHNSGGATVDLNEWLQTRRTDLPSPIVALDHITDPYNLGAIIRSCHWFGVPLVIIPERRSATGGDVVARASAGAVSFVTMSFVTNLRRSLELCREAGYWIYSADAKGVPIPEAEVNSPTVLILGAEGKGVSPGLEKVIDKTIRIPGRPGTDSTVDSLNVSVSAGVLLYELQYGANRDR